jgi:hypothetical protein
MPPPFRSRRYDAFTPHAASRRRCAYLLMPHRLPAAADASPRRRAMPPCCRCRWCAATRRHYFMPPALPICHYWPGALARRRAEALRHCFHYFASSAAATPAFTASPPVAECHFAPRLSLPLPPSRRCHAIDIMPYAPRRFAPPRTRHAAPAASPALMPPLRPAPCRQL